LIEARSYRGQREPTMRELAGQLARAIVAARLRRALPPRRTTYAERVAIARELRWGALMAVAADNAPIDLQVNAPAPTPSRGALPPPDTEELIIVTGGQRLSGWQISH
jgi:hypothetical protein